MFGEPPRSEWDLNFDVAGIPVRVHPLFWLISAVLGINAARSPAGIDPVAMLLWVVAVFFSILVHEMGHAVVARWHGYRPWVTLYGMGGLASYDGYHQSAKSKILISAAGPVAGFLFAGVILLGMQIAGAGVQLVPSLMPFVWHPFESGYLNLLLFFLLFVNVIWGLVNLLPVYPLDGGQISREVFVHYDPSAGIRNSLMLSMVAAGAVAVYALTRGELFITLLFGYLAYLSYNTLQIYSGRGGSRW